MSVMASAAAWGLGHWDNMEEYVRSVPNNTMVYPLFQSALNIHHGRFSVAQKVGVVFEVGSALVRTYVGVVTLYTGLLTIVGVVTVWVGVVTGYSGCGYCMGVCDYWL